MTDPASAPDLRTTADISLLEQAASALKSQPIATFPKDGQTVLAWDYNWWPAYWSNSEGRIVKIWGREFTNPPKWWAYPPQCPPDAGLAKDHNGSVKLLTANPALDAIQKVKAQNTKNAD
jgi:hypothetical protein